MQELQGQVALVTGGSRGIGLAIARELAQAGARLALVARDGERAQSAAAELPGEGHRGFGCDVADAEACAALVKQVEGDFGQLDVLVNNAGVTRDNVLMRIKDDDWNAVLDTNLRGAFNLMRAASRGMMKRRTGRIINITSVVGIIGNAGQANYAASKAGLIGLTKSVAKELAGRGVLVNAVAPGYIETDMTSDLPEAARTALMSNIALGRLGRPEDIAPAVRFLAGPGAAYITGQTLVVDGGMVM
ncbi:MAG: 3-oxoacyl-[acyl-carrier protein] reductase [uncultured Gemmatimonadetes bacterium]|uniref:3-oxoacyl-[acyl-carrier-protein] reductase n=1 Tax=uncultured Gemmatimonadota bacterium TaxID=203437 RepID=A0A6J4KD59_9BACT|nr:MAG: 3-oxoacyl-[acyl-carrier protein] reductase [uncultured Gemmatimonadota bacterium]